MIDRERRQFFRSPCQVLLDFRQVDKNTIDQGSPQELFESCDALTLLSEFQQIDKQCGQIARRLSKQDSALVDYLDLTQAKVNKLAQIVTAQMPGLNTLPRVTIDLSETGIAFSSNRLFYREAVLALRLVFLPDYLTVVLFAKVTRCEKMAPLGQIKRDGYHIAAEFLPLTEPTRRIIAQQVLKAQRAAKLISEADADEQSAHSQGENPL